MQVRSLKLQDVDFGNRWLNEVHNRWTYDDFLSHSDWKDGWVSFDTALYHSGTDLVYLGVTSFDANRSFCAYDRKRKQFVDLNYDRVAERFDAKFHRSLVQSNDGCIYGAPALLHCPDKYFEAPGAAIVKYDPMTGDIGKLGIPLPHVYVQAVAIDERRRRLYLLYFGPEYLGSYDLDTGESRILAQLSSGLGMAQGENILVDNDGCVWSNWSLTRAWSNSPGPDGIRQCKYDPREDRMVFFQTGLPMPNGREGFAKAEAFFRLGNGRLFASGANGSLYSINRETGRAEFLFTPIRDRPSRLTSLAETGDGVAYGITGRAGKCELMRFHYHDATYELLGPVVDDSGATMFQCHDIVATQDGVLYACENDNPYRSSYLWEIVL